mmetsp:Transcript_4379/g.4089  ORF Transcript_4379/g.4089 Transcript_4379/m.4089 type:complete len:176 (-) Transcript_4379:70-597(-)|eukprot:CAMPEP_0197006864 /NCGR_PEP_ID=MMETSP1380-20130617/37596_1 /TAXON_ID=5936 /ORGANISM="Euplotes crassus, Strain CT5" /LENGTH=175 /DNA_ID=CAMNT_0042426691 /DNA_START=12 /DNA_END=539 /DNA_ORIENTATION=+
MDCPICYISYDAKDHTPKLLPCAHTFCQTCLNSLKERSEKISCALCKKEWVMKSKRFRTNFALLGMIELWNDQRERLRKAESQLNKISIQQQPTGTRGADITLPEGKKREKLVIKPSRIRTSPKMSRKVDLKFGFGNGDGSEPLCNQEQEQTDKRVVRTRLSRPRSRKKINPIGL